MASAMLAGIAIAGGAYAARTFLRASRMGGTHLPAATRGFRLGDLFKKQFYEGSFDAEISKKEAQLILEVKENASRKDVMTRYKRLMVLNHPDQGGSELIATKINEAKELLIKGMKK